MISPAPASIFNRCPDAVFIVQHRACAFMHPHIIVFPRTGKKGNRLTPMEALVFGTANLEIPIFIHSRKQINPALVTKKLAPKTGKYFAKIFPAFAPVIGSEYKLKV
jgi:hypothetical protein